MHSIQIDSLWNSIKDMASRGRWTPCILNTSSMEPVCRYRSTIPQKLSRDSYPRNSPCINLVKIHYVVLKYFAHTHTESQRQDHLQQLASYTTLRWGNELGVMANCEKPKIIFITEDLIQNQSSFRLIALLRVTKVLTLTEAHANGEETSYCIYIKEPKSITEWYWIRK